jgi:hypothetical protein
MGFPEDRIIIGVDVIDNDYFSSIVGSTLRDYFDSKTSAKNS